MQSIKQIITRLIETLYRSRKVLLALSCLVVFVVTYVLILPAFTLEKDKAAELGGIDVPGVEQTDDANEASDAEAGKVSSEEPKAAKTEKAVKESSQAKQSKTASPVTLQNEDNKDYSVAVEGDKTVLSEDMRVNVREIDQSTKKLKKEYDSLYSDALEAVQKAQKEEGLDQPSDFAFAKFYYISLRDGKAEVEPDSAVDVKISFSEELQKELKVTDPDKIHIVHFTVDKDTGEVTPEVLDPETTDITVEHNKVTEAAFTANSFSVFAVVYTADLNTEVITAKGDTYEVSVKYESDANIPESAELRVREILPEDEEYKAVQEKAGEELTDEINRAIPSHPALFDIGIYDGETEIEPAPGSSVQVEVKLKKNSVTGLYSGKDAPLLINEKPVNADEQKLVQKLQVIHDVKDGSLEVVDVEQKDNKGSVDEITGQFDTESFSNWLLYLDEEFPNNEITVYQGDSITLRPYGEWYWKSEDEPDALRSLKWVWPASDYNTTTGSQNVVVDYNGTTEQRWGYTQANTKNGICNFRGLAKYDRELEEDYWYYDATLNQTGEFFIYVGTDANHIEKTIKVKVEARPQGDDGKPGTVQGIPNIKVNLFDYDYGGVLDEGIEHGYRDAQGRWHKQDWNSNWEKNHNLANNVFNNTVNIGHSLKFLSSGSAGANHGINGYTKSAPRQGIVQNTLINGYPALSNTYGTYNSESLKYLFDKDDTSWGNDNAVKAYPDVAGLFQLDSDGYYYYNSNKNYAYYDSANNNMILYEHTYSQDTDGTQDVNGKPIGFFPFHEYNSTNDLHVNQEKALNHHFGMSMQVEFAMDHSKQNDGKDIIYEFSGDDDLWVYVDNQLVLDIGGIHQPVRGYINFTKGEVYVYGTNGNRPKKVDFVSNLAPDVKHTLDMFYVERGGCDSNLSVKFNLPLVVGKAEITKKGEILNADGSVGSTPLQGVAFDLYDNAECTGTPIKTVSSDENGIVTFDKLEIGETYYMKESQAPDHYETNTNIYKVQVTHDTTESEANIIYVKNGDNWTALDDNVVLNTKEKTSLSVAKHWQSPDNSNWPDDVESVTVGLYSSVNGADPTPVKDGASNKTCTLNADQTSYTFTNLITTDNNGNTITYSAREESVKMANGATKTPEEAGFDVNISSDNGAVSITNIQKGALRITKSVEYNGGTSFTQAARNALARKYHFTVYKDIEGKEPLLINGVPQTVELEINSTMAQKSQTLTGIPIGNYYIFENEDELTNGVHAVTNPLAIKVSAGETATAEATADFVNDYTDGPDEAYISIKKKFNGVDKEDIPQLDSNFAITVEDNATPKNTYILKKNTHSWTETYDADGNPIWSWKPTGISTDTDLTYTVNESNVSIEGYNFNGGDGFGDPGTQIKAADMTFDYHGIIDTTNSHTDWDVDNTIFACTLTKGPYDNKKAALFVTKQSLSEAQKKAVKDVLIPILAKEDAPGQWSIPDDHIFFYSVDMHPNGFAVNKGSITFDVDNKVVTFSGPSVWKHVAYATFETDETFEGADLHVTNNYEGQTIPVDVIKVNQEKRQEKLPGAEFTLYKLDGNTAPTEGGTFPDKKKIGTEQTDGNGKLTFSNVAKGYYEIEETKSPDGYVLLEEAKLYFKVARGKVVWLEKGTGAPSTWAEKTIDDAGIVEFEKARAAVAADPDTGTAASEATNDTFKVGNTPGAELPHTGGIGTTIFYIFGSALAIGCAVVLIARRRLRRD